MKPILFLLLALPIFNCSLSAQKTNELKKIAKLAYDSVPSLGSILVWQNNGLVCEEYFNEANKETIFNVKSVTKSVVSALAGIAHDKGLLPDLKTPVLNVLPEYATDTNRYKSMLNVWDLLTMQSGFMCDDNNPPRNGSRDLVINALNLPFECAPGTKFKYCSLGSHVLGVIVAKCVKTNLKAYADTMLFNHIGVTISSWSKDALGRNMGSHELYMKATDMVKFGLLYLNEGQVNGKQIISKAWIDESLSEQVKLNEWDVLPGANGYGYFWWRRVTNGHQAYVASGFGGQLICIIPDLKTVIVTTCFVDDKNRGRSEIKRLHGFIDKIVKASN